MDVFRSRSSRLISTLPTKLYRALPAVILGTLFNILDSGILIFPTDGGAFRPLQLQGLSMYIMSTLTSQLVMTLGGSQFPGALGAMLIEILPFLRGIATDTAGKSHGRGFMACDRHLPWRWHGVAQRSGVFGRCHF
ncbi:hypothetical protein B0H11DRAFT_2275043 [Mycena galericulata]|nr:hypothetical protein B0H11DRAFT_2275043 [Mycena galericulata]